MPLILNIDTATEFASVCLAKDEEILMLVSNKEQKNHASFLQPAIKKIAEETGYTLNEIDAVAVSNGPGSYTGLRVGLSSAKGLCFALNKPLLLLNTLEIMAWGCIAEYEKNNSINDNLLFCPMIDARRMDVFAAVYTTNLHVVVAPQALKINENSFSELLNNQPIIFFGSGSGKCENILTNPNSIFSKFNHSAASMVSLSLQQYQKAAFSDLAYSEPFYLKEFYTLAKKLI
ncbi:MAG: tRNA (adenosine(37)-N6)-threonylcarbamoyltransferase complex dimerization subunit type 1 TsaB [Chitinophaga sp.]|jgi:tRNA threonylcarbamoyladenosine biosynthesis protein TsaB|nr:tRNA (adenosine(37)-N6)-threonylcarbamoyltransferase complex dimerization subunit type 1 TsaB [Chitinophaga sp.]